MKRLLLTLLLLLVSAPLAEAQILCNRWSHGLGTGPLPVTQLVPGRGNESIYLCGFVITASGSALTLRVVAGTGVNCADNQSEIVPPLDIGAGTSLVNRSQFAIEFTPPGHSLCIATDGQSNAKLTAILYWVQR